ncbi:MAG: hypothetical protein ACI8SA_001543 [Dokdonia sp.]
MNSLKENLAENNFSPDYIDFNIPTHLHYDHAFSKEDTTPAFIKEQYDAYFIQWDFMGFEPIE